MIAKRACVIQCQFGIYLPVTSVTFIERKRRIFAVTNEYRFVRTGGIAYNIVSSGPLVTSHPVLVIMIVCEHRPGRKSLGNESEFMAQSDVCIEGTVEIPLKSAGGNETQWIVDIGGQSFHIVDDTTIHDAGIH